MGLRVGDHGMHYAQNSKTHAPNVSNVEVIQMDKIDDMLIQFVALK